MAARIKKSNETEHQIDKPYNSLQKRFDNCPFTRTQDSRTAVLCALCRFTHWGPNPPDPLGRFAPKSFELGLGGGHPIHDTADSTSFDPPLLRSCPTGALKGLRPLKLPLVGLRPPRSARVGPLLVNNTFK